MPNRLKAAILVILLLNVPILATQFTLWTYDAQTHIFFANHYLQGWFTTFEPKWFLDGMWVYGYPPLVHQLIALASLPFGMEMGYRIVLLAGLIMFPIAMYKFAKEMVGDKVAGYAALVCAFVPGLYVMNYTFGQLPSMLGMVFGLLAGSYFSRFLRTGNRRNLVIWMLLTGTAVTCHHHTVMFIIPMLMAAFFAQHLLKSETPKLKILKRAIIGGIAFAIALFTSLIPFWWWYLTQNLPQTEIPHMSRWNIFATPVTSEIFFWGIYGVMLILIPVGFVWFGKRRDLWPWIAIMLLLAGLGLGGMTPLPRIILGFAGLWKWMTYERFAIWAAILGSIPAGAALMWMSQIRRQRIKYVLYLAIFILALFGVGREALYSQVNRVLPTPLLDWEKQEIVKFLAKDNHSNWTYLTFGMGEAEVAELSRMTNAHTVDGTYYTGRINEAERLSGMGIIDAAFWDGPAAINFVWPMLAFPEKWHLKWAFVADPRMNTALSSAMGKWTPLYPLGSDIDFKNGDPQNSRIWVWVVNDWTTVPPIPPQKPPYQPFGFPFLWGIIPLYLLIVSTAYTLITKQPQDEVG